MQPGVQQTARQQPRTQARTQPATNSQVKSQGRARGGWINDGRYKLPPLLRKRGDIPWSRGYSALQAPGGWTYRVDVHVLVGTLIRR